MLTSKNCSLLIKHYICGYAIYAAASIINLESIIIRFYKN